MPPLVFSGIASFFTNLLIGWFVYSRNRKSKTNILFALFSLMVSGWSVGSFFENVIPDRSIALNVLRINYLFAVWLPAVYVHFVYSFSPLTKSKKTILRIAYSLSVFLSVFVFTPLLVSDLRLIQTEPYRYFISLPGPMYYVFFIFFAAAVTEVLRTTLTEMSRSDGLRYTQFKYLSIANAIAIIAGFEYFSRVFGLLRSPPIDDFILVVYLMVLAYAIVRHQLLDIEVIVKRTLVFTGLVGSVVAVVSLVAFVSQDVLVRYIAVPRWLSNIFAAMIIAGLYGPLRNRLTDVTEKYLFQKKYDYKELLKKFTDEVMVIVDLKQLLKMTVSTLSDTVKLESCSLLLLNKEKRTYELVASKGTNGQQLVLGEQEPFIEFLRETHEPIGIDGKVRFPETVMNRMKQAKAQLSLPLHVHDDLIGVLCLGKKKSDEEFTQDDLDILLPLAHTLAIAVSNAQLVAELAITQAEAAQKEKLAVIGTLSAGINHEICNPLGIVKAQCEAFLLDIEDGILIGKSSNDVLDRTTTIMRVALKQIDRATAITQKLSNFAKPIKDPKIESVDVAKEIDEVLTLVGHDMQLEKINVEKDFQPTLPSIVVDRRQFQEVLFNLIRNAGQAIRPPGTIIVRAHTGKGTHLRIEICDSGGGISPERLGKIYDPFFTTKEPGQGTGLGLFIVRQIVERNKGRISVDSKVGEGTTFFLDFPFASDAVAASR